MNDRFLHKVAHGVSAAAMSAGCAALADRDVAVAAAAGAMTSEIVADILAQPLQEDVTQEIQAKREEHGRALTAEEVRDIWDAKARQITQIAKLTGALSGLFTGDANGITTAYTAGSNAIDNNFMQKTMPVLWAAMELGLLEAAGTLKIAPAPDMTGIRTLDQPSLDQKAKELQQDPGYQASHADMGMGTTGDAPAGSAAGHVLHKVQEPAATDSTGEVPKQNPFKSKNPEKTVEKIQQRQQEYIDKLEQYKKNPDAFYNDGQLENAPNDGVRQKIINGRIKKLEKEIRDFDKQKEDILQHAK